MIEKIPLPDAAKNHFHTDFLSAPGALLLLLLLLLLLPGAFPVVPVVCLQLFVITILLFFAKTVPMMFLHTWICLQTGCFSIRYVGWPAHSW